MSLELHQHLDNYATERGWSNQEATGRVHLRFTLNKMMKDYPQIADSDILLGLAIVKQEAAVYGYEAAVLFAYPVEPEEPDVPKIIAETSSWLAQEFAGEREESEYQAILTTMARELAIM